MGKKSDELQTALNETVEEVRTTLDELLEAAGDAPTARRLRRWSRSTASPTSSRRSRRSSPRRSERRARFWKIAGTVSADPGSRFQAGDTGLSQR
jgi:hypothetical protein